MKKKHNKFLKTLGIFIIVISITAFGGFVAFNNGAFKAFASKNLNESLLNSYNTTIEIYDKDGNLLENNTFIKSFVKVETLPDYVGNAFVAIEDKDFYKHKGISYKGIARAVINNIKSKSYSQGGSTISQQLIKNTHLSNEKTLKRKVDEALLTQQLEEKYSKQEILQAYLNAIYFGQGTFGIEKASQKYFSKPAEKLSLAEAATLAGIIKSPLNFSPISQKENCINRRNLVLKNMYQEKMITKKQFEEAKSSDLEVNLSNNDLGENNYNAVAIKQAATILGLCEQDIIIGGYKIYTNQDSYLQKVLEEEITKDNNTCDKQAIIIENKSGKVLAYKGSSNYNLTNKKLQPGSILKPIAVYAPALEEKIITTSTPILDEKINIKGYSPKNYDNKYHGWVSVKQALSQSLNIPAVKILQYISIPRAKEYTNKFGINLEKDKGYSIALGGLKEGVEFVAMANSYTSFANKGKINKPTFISSIKNKYGRTIYKTFSEQKKVISEDNAYLMTDMLKESVKSGTAKKLSLLSKNNLASKTGTAGNEQGNSDIWNISYTPKYTTAVWLGDIKNNSLPISYTGGNQATSLASKIIKKLGDDTNFIRPKTIQSKYISLIDLEENNKLTLALDDVPDRYKKLELFSLNSMPTEKSNKLNSLPKLKLKGEIIDDEIQITFDTKKYLTYELFRKEKGGDYLVETIKDSSQGAKITLPITTKNKIEEYYVKYHITHENSPKTKICESIKIFSTGRSDWE